MGITIREKNKGSGVWWIFINHNGVRKSKRVGSRTTAIKAKKEAEEALTKRKLGIIENENKTFGHYCNKWLNIFAPSDCKRSTIDDYKSLVRNHLDGQWVCWDMPVKQITVGMIEDFLASKRKQRSASTVKHIKCCISLALKRAVSDNAIGANPCTEAEIVGNKKDRKKKKREKVKVFTETQSELLLDTFKKHCKKHWLMILFMLKTGIRTSEAAELRWSDIDLDNRVAHIQRGFVRGRIEDTTKSHEDREVDLTPHLVNELRKAKLAAKTDELVFPNSAGNHLDFNKFRSRHYNKMVAKAKLPARRLHDLRHTFASILLKRCRDILYVQKQLGHSKPSITLDIYSHFLEDDAPTKMVDMLDAPICSPTAPKPNKELTAFG